MKTINRAEGRMGLRTVLLLFLSLLVMVPAASAAIVSMDDFEDGELSDWQETITTGQGGSGSTGVQMHAGSQMAYAYHAGKGSHSLSHDFAYAADDILLFDMQAVANTGTNMYGSTLHSRTGVEVSFLNTFNVPIASFSLVNATNPSSLGADSHAIDSEFHLFVASMGDYAEFAGLNAADPISMINLSFFSTADYHWGGNIYPNGISHATVWFDNVTVEAVPLPPAVLLLSSGLIGLVGIRRRKN